MKDEEGAGNMTEEMKQPEKKQPEATGTDGASKKTTNGNGKKRRAMIILLVAVLVCGWFGIRWWIKGKTHIETDNAFIEAKTVSISSKVSGTVKRVLVNDNQHVKKGDLLVELDEVDYQVQVAKAEAGVGVAENETGGEYLKAEGGRATVQSTKARFDQAELDLRRGEALYKREVIPKEQLDRLKTAQRVAESQLKEAQEAYKRALTEAGLAGKAGGNRAKVLQRQAQLREARLQLSYTRIVAPGNGYITRKGVEPGANIQAGQPLMALVPLQDAWITANYKEGQLTHIKPGQKVEFTVDAYPGRTFKGRVDSIMAGTGAAFSLLPPENATGNYVKVVQRIPVKIVIDNNSDPDHLLRVGMSVIPTVLVERSTGDILKGLIPF
jgi:membrane fusion protein, multidrug efflux system